MTGLIGVLPVILTFAIAQAFDSFGALVLSGIHIGFMALGTWAFAEWFGS
jgi:hypothetical protein